VMEDDPSMLRGLTDVLRREGYDVHAVTDGEAGYEWAKAKRPDLIVLDLMLPKMSGLDVIRALRADDPDTPILVLSAKDQEGDKVLALSLGADDYVTKPFGLAELIARIRAALRRKRRRQPGAATSFGDVTLDLEGRRVLVGGKEVETTAREFDLLRFFHAHPAAAFSREQLMQQVWGPDHFGTARTVDNFVARLRAKIEDDPDEPHHIETVRGVGYRFNG